ncbi:MAG: transposase [Thermoflexibacteraceae bacterium]
MENHSKNPIKYSYKITNWKEYYNSLKKRGKVSFWINSKLLSIWKDLDVIKINFGEQFYPDVNIEFCLLIKNIYHLPFRQTAGFIDDLLALQGLENYCVPDSSTLCRRAKHLQVNYFSTLKDKKDLHILVDSTGLKDIVKARGCSHSGW